MDDFIAANHQYRKTAAISHTPADGSAQLPSHRVRYDNGPIDNRLVVYSLPWTEKDKAIYLAWPAPSNLLGLTQQATVETPQ